MDFMHFAVNFLVDEISGDSESDSVGAVAAVAGPGTDAREVAPLHGEYGRLDDGEDDRESVVDAGSDIDGGEDGRDDGREVGGGDHDDDGDGDEEGSVRWWSPQEVGHRYEPREKEGEERRVGVDTVEDARERDRRFWETCLASGYP